MPGIRNNNCAESIHGKNLIKMVNMENGRKTYAEWLQQRNEKYAKIFLYFHFYCFYVAAKTRRVMLLLLLSPYQRMHNSIEH